MPRQLRMGGGIMEVAPRQGALFGGLKKAFKGISKGIGSFLKSDIGKLALTAGSLYGLGGASGLGSFFGKGSFSPLLRKVGGDFAQSQFGSMLSGAKNFLGSNIGKIVTGATAGKLFGGMEPQQIQALKGDPEALRQYLEQYYDNLNLPSVDTNDKNAMAAYTSKKENFLNRNMKAGGGRMGYAEGMEDPMPKEKSLKENLKFVKEIKGGVAPSTTIYMLKKYMDEALEKGQITKEQHIKMLMPFFGETGENVTKDFERYEQKMAYGGRMGYQSGTENPLATLFKGDKIPPVKMPDPFKKFLDNMTPEEKRQYEGTMSIYKKIQESMMKRLPKISEEEKEKRKIQNEIRKKQAEEMGLPPYVSLMANGGRINRAYGSDELVEQASGIEGLDININPKGVKELDLRETGGFIPPVGVKEKADDIPAMLSNNEFVFTADAVRAAGGGSVNKGAQIMYDTMKKLENGGTV
jgi:hypothetical protein